MKFHILRVIFQGRKILLSFLFLLSFLLLGAQPPVSEEDFDKAYEYRISQEILYGVYIPEDITDAFIQLNKLIDDDSRMKFKNMPEADAAIKLHFSFGRWILHNWGFYGGSRFSKYLNSLGLYDPDVMAKFVIITYHRNLNRKPLEVKALLEKFEQEKQTKEATEKSQQKVISEQTRKLTPEEAAKRKEKIKN
ncbi:MAG: hypothetical protein DWQ02_20240 [Bacteroidetes bacterium]|nr:MAG: hypothetical protein DWQ02_20240 [Bacteroidota bacterium]